MKLIKQQQVQTKLLQLKRASKFPMLAPIVSLYTEMVSPSDQECYGNKKEEISVLKWQL